MWHRGHQSGDIITTASYNTALGSDTLEATTTGHSNTAIGYFTLGRNNGDYNGLFKILKVPKKIIAKHGAVSYETCLSMVKNLNRISKTNICISVTGIAGPKGGTKQKPVGLVYIGIKKGKKIQVNKYFLKGKNRTSIQKATVNKSLNLILRLLK